MTRLPPCLTLRRNTERPITLTHGTNCLAPPETPAILRAYADRMAFKPDPDRRPRLWDGRAAERIARILIETG